MNNMVRAETEVWSTARLLDHFRHCLAAHGLYPHADAENSTVLHYAFYGCEVVLRQGRGRLDLALAAPSAAILSDLKVNAVRYVAELDVAAAETVRWSNEVELV